MIKNLLALVLFCTPFAEPMKSLNKLFSTMKIKEKNIFKTHLKNFSSFASTKFHNPGTNNAFHSTIVTSKKFSPTNYKYLKKAFSSDNTTIEFGPFQNTEDDILFEKIIAAIKKNRVFNLVCELYNGENYTPLLMILEIIVKFYSIERLKQDSEKLFHELMNAFIHVCKTKTTQTDDFILKNLQSMIETIAEPLPLGSHDNLKSLILELFLSKGMLSWKLIINTIFTQNKESKALQLDSKKLDTLVSSYFTYPDHTAMIKILDPLISFEIGNLEHESLTTIQPYAVLKSFIASYIQACRLQSTFSDDNIFKALVYMISTIKNNFNPTLPLDNLEGPFENLEDLIKEMLKPN